MGLTAPFLEALATLGLEGSPDAAAIKSAYRRLVLVHPPDRDPDTFRRVRSAFELLKDPTSRTREILLRSVPAIPPPVRPRVLPTPPGATALAVLRAIAGRADARLLLTGEVRAPAPTVTDG